MILSYLWVQHCVVMCTCVYTFASISSAFSLASCSMKAIMCLICRNKQETVQVCLKMNKFWPHQNQISHIYSYISNTKDLVFWKTNTSLDPLDHKQHWDLIWMYLQNRQLTLITIWMNTFWNFAHKKIYKKKIFNPLPKMWLYFLIH